MTKLSSLFILTILVVILSSKAAVAAESVRFYELTKKDKEKRVFNIGSMEGPGCHSFLRKHSVHRFSQTGFKSCTLHSEKKCNPDGLVTATWSGKAYRRADIDIKKPQIDLLPGSEWVLAERNVQVRSWNCVQN